MPQRARCAAAGRGSVPRGRILAVDDQRYFRELIEGTGARFDEGKRPKGFVEASLRATFAASLFEATGDL